MGPGLRPGAIQPRRLARPGGTWSRSAERETPFDSRCPTRESIKRLLFRPEPEARVFFIPQNFPEKTERRTNRCGVFVFSRVRGIRAASGRRWRPRHAVFGQILRLKSDAIRTDHEFWKSACPSTSCWGAPDLPLVPVPRCVRRADGYTNHAAQRPSPLQECLQ